MKNRKIKITLAFCLLLLVLANIKPSSAFTWSSQEKRLTTDPYFDGLSAITETQDKKTMVVWQKEMMGSYTLYYAISSDQGASWSREMNLTKLLSEDTNTDPSITKTSNGTLWVVWSSYRQPSPPPPEPDFNMTASPQSLSIPKGNEDNSIITITSINNFNDPVNLRVGITPFNVTTALDPAQVTPPPNSTADSTLTVTVGTEAIPGNYTLPVIGTSPEKGHSINVKLEITDSTLSSASKSIMTLSFPSEAEGNYDIYYKMSHDNGASWSSDTQLTEDQASDLSPSILEAANGTLWVVWASSRTGNYKIYYKTSSDFGASWSNDVQLTFDPDHDKRPQIAQMKDGSIWVVWYSDRYGNNTILYKKYDESSWSSDTRLTYNTDSNTSPAIVQSIDGTMLIFWTLTGLGPNDAGDIYYKQSFDNGQTWSSNIQFTTDSNEDLWPAVTRSSDTRIWVVWTSNRGDQPDGNFDIWYRASLVGDINEDGVVNIIDLATVARAYGTSPGDPNWNPDADINKDNLVDIDDLILVGRNFGAT